MWLFYVRHGQPDYENDRLTEEGKKQAQAVAERFSLLGLDKIYSSTMGRAMETAGYTARKLGLKIKGVDFAREDRAWEEFGATQEDGSWGWCFWNNKILSDFRSEKVKKLGEKWYDSPLFKDTKFKSGTLHVRKGVTEFMKDLGYRYDENSGTYATEKHIYDRVALFAHGGFSMAFTSCLLGIPYPEFCTRFRCIGVSAITSFWIDDQGDEIMPKLYQYGNDSHLYKENLLDGFDMRTL
ncbi:MAG: histidine phosphatase family protein [Clostridia bacterium]|nr:histidine phosphatase family protein [Clostridia bacterium]